MTPIQAQLISLNGLAGNPTYMFGAVLNMRNILDIIIISAFFYFAIAILKKTRSASVILGISMFVAAYGVSVFLNLPLTRTLFQYFFGFLLIIVAIIFQNEFRRFFSLIGVLGGRSGIKLSDQIIDVIARSVKKMAAARTGALMVFPAKENIQSYVKGGHMLDGKLSEPLLLSIFDPSSPGHDGAVVIENGKIKKFGVYLPLGKDVDAVKNFGTRHLAAFGLSEVSDALIVAVSEEKGTISVFRNKSSVVMKDADQFEKTLRDFIGEKSPAAGTDKKDFMKLLKDRIFPAALSIVLAFSFWAIFSFQTASFVQKKLVVPLEFKNAPDNFIVESRPDKLTVTFSGKEIDFNDLNVDELKASINLSGIKPDRQKVTVTEENIRHPLYISIVKIDPETVSLNFAPYGNN